MVELPAAHGAVVRIAGVAGRIQLRSRTNTLGYEQLDRLSNQLAAVIPEKPLGLRVDQHDGTGVVHPDKSIGDCFEQDLVQLRRVRHTYPFGVSVFDAHLGPR